MRLLNRLDDLRIRHKLLLVSSAIFILPLALGSSLIHRSVLRTIEANIESELTNTTATILNMVNNAAKLSIKNYLRAIAEKNSDVAHYYYGLFRSGQITEAEAMDRVRKVLLSQTISNTGYIYCLDSQGVIVHHPHQELVGSDLSKHAFIQDQIGRRVGYLEYEWKNPSEPKTRAKALYMTHFKPWDWIISASSYRDEFNALINVDDFRDSILSLQFGQTGYSYVIDVHGKLVLHRILEGINILQEQDADGRYFIKQLIEQRSGKIVYSWKNPGEVSHREKLVIFNHIPEFDWIVASSSYLEEFYAPLITVERIFLFNLAILFLLAPPLILWISSTITNPLQELMQKFAQGAQGDISVRMQRRRNDEVGMLAYYFNTFMQQLEQFSTSLRAEIEERKKAESAIRKSEARYRELVQNANSIIMRIDIHGKITFFNEFAQAFLGYREPDILGQSSIGTIMPEIDSEGRPMRPMLEQITRYPEKHGYYEIENVRRDGQRVWVAWTNKAVRDVQGSIVEYLCIGHDITEAKKAHQEMGRMRRYLQKIVDAMPSVLVGVDLAGRVTQWNQEAQKLTGISEATAKAQLVNQVMPGLRPHRELVTQAIARQRTMKVEQVAHPAGLASHHADIMVYPIVGEQVEGVVIRVDDISARVRLEKIMVQTEKMMSVGGLAAGMAHEINNPLGAMVQNAQNILRRLSPDLVQNQVAATQCGVALSTVTEYLERRQIFHLLEGIRESGHRAAIIVKNMLSFSRSSESCKTPVCLTELLDKTISLAAHDYDLKKKYDFRRIKIERHYDHELGKVPCVPTEIEQVVLNLLRNAAQALALKERSDSPATIVLRLYREDGMAVMAFEDNGPGIPEPSLKRIFEPFYTTKHVGVGTGLGLSVSYFIVTNNHNGVMEVQSWPEKGSAFIIRLPLKPIAAGHAAHAA